MERKRQNTTRKIRARKVSVHRKRSTRSSTSDIKSFVRVVHAYHHKEGRHALPWRVSPTPYAVLVSELMLQQTQVERVVPKFIAFMERFPTVRELATASQKDVLILWQGLGYNRRARFLHLAAQSVVARGGFPHDYNELLSLPGVGPYTAGAIRAFAYNAPELFLETNIRAVLIHHFFPRDIAVSDASLLAILERSMSYVPEPRIWYAALMDYGSYLKRTKGNITRRSATYVRQSTFKGSQREIRGSIIRILSQRSMSLPELLKKHLPERHKQVHSALANLLKEKLIILKAGKYILA